MKLFGKNIPVGARFKHFRYGIFEVYGFAYHYSTSEKFICCAQITSNAPLVVSPGVLIVPEKEFCAEVDREKYPDATQKYAFEMIER